MRARATVLLTLAIVLAGCASTKQRSAPTTSLSPTAVSTSSSAPTLPTTSSTIAVATTTSSVAPTTTLPVEDQVRAAANAAYLEYWTCLQKPADCDPSRSSAPGSDAFNALTRTAHDLVAGGFYFGPSEPGYMAIESIQPMADYTLVTSCWWITAVFYGPPPSPDQPPIVQSNRRGWTRQTDQFVQGADGSWKIRREDTITTKTGVNECPPA